MYLLMPLQVLINQYIRSVDTGLTGGHCPVHAEDSYRTALRVPLRGLQETGSKHSNKL